MNTNPLEPFLHPYQIHFLKSQLKKWISNYYFGGDNRVLAAMRDALQKDIEQELQPQTPEQEELLRGASKVRDKEELSLFMAQLEPYIIPFPTVTPEEIRKLFAKVKKFVLPDLAAVNYKELTYFGWRDIATNRLYLVHQENGTLIGTVCQYVVGSKSRASHCFWCHSLQPSGGVGLVTARAKKRHLDDYKTSGTYICLDSQACNRNLTSTVGLQKFFDQLSR